VSSRIRRFRITGRVQGVSFRFHTSQQAERLGIVGYAANLEDGSVEVLARGSEQALELLHAWLRHGPRLARVDDLIELEVDEAAGIAGGFEIRGFEIR